MSEALGYKLIYSCPPFFQKVPGPVSGRAVSQIENLPELRIVVILHGPQPWVARKLFYNPIFRQYQCSKYQSGVVQHSDGVMHRFVGVVSRRLNESGNRINENFAGRHFKTVLQAPNYYLNAYKYNYRNPVEAGLCQRVEDYPYSTLYGLLGRSHLLIPVEDDIHLGEDLVETLRWLNEAPPGPKLEAVRFALKRPFFQYKKDRATNAPLVGEGELI